MVFHVITIFPGLIRGYFESGILSRALDKGLIKVNVKDLRKDHALNRYGQIDDRIYGSGKGMLFRPEPLAAAIDEIRRDHPESRVVCLTPQGRPFTNRTARELAGEKSVVLIAARYEGVDARIVRTMVDDEISVGDYVLTGGELPALVVMDATARFLDGTLQPGSADEDSFESGLLEHDHYTRPDVFRGLAVPAVLLTGNHAGIRKYRLAESLRKTYFNRPELLREHGPRAETGEPAARDERKRIIKENKALKEYLAALQDVAKEWRDVRRNSEDGKRSGGCGNAAGPDTRAENRTGNQDHRPAGPEQSGKRGAGTADSAVQPE